MLLLIYVLLLIIPYISPDQSSSFCLCSLKNILEEYALLTTDQIPPRYRSLFKEDIGFFIRTSAQWKPVNDTTWIELSHMINAPSGMYTYISLDGIQPINNGLKLDSFRSAYLAEIITTYRLLMNYVERFHENVIKTRTRLCLNPNEKTNENNWKQFFIPG